MWVIPETSEFYHFVQDMEGLKSDWPEHWIQHLMSSLWRSKPMLKLSSVKMRLKRHKWLQKLCGLTLKLSHQKDFEDALISFLQDSPVNQYQSQDEEKENRTIDGFGMILRESLRQYDLFGSSSKTSPDSCPLDTPQFTEAYGLWVTKLRRACLQRQRSARLTREKGCLSWPSPEARNQEGYQVVNGKKVPRLGQQVNWPTIQLADAKMCKFDKRGNPHLGKVAGVWPTPNVPNRGKELSKKHRPESGGIDLQSSVGLLAPDKPSTNGKSRGLWTTPSTDDVNRRKGKYKQGGTALNTQTKGKLNPDWVEQLMGLTVGWTDLDSWEMV